ncbi:hypothetical protein [Pseudarthrobacter sp. N5]|uniref:hypothetical protein n=1 Tax=Pseudarthrobacter sp. N5 TaxID=3418416 RepID=UPI003CF6CFDC
MANKKKWKDLPPAVRIGTVIVGVAQLVFLAAAQRDISQRPSDQIRGSKGIWRVVTLLNFVGPASYFVFGRKKATSKIATAR